MSLTPIAISADNMNDLKNMNQLLYHRIVELARLLDSKEMQWQWKCWFVKEEGKTVRQVSLLIILKLTKQT